MFGSLIAAHVIQVQKQARGKKEGEHHRWRDADDHVGVIPYPPNIGSVIVAWDKLMLEWPKRSSWFEFAFTPRT